MKKIGKITLKEQIKDSVVLDETEMKNIVGGSSSGGSNGCGPHGATCDTNTWCDAGGFMGKCKWEEFLIGGKKTKLCACVR